MKHRSVLGLLVTLFVAVVPACLGEEFPLPGNPRDRVVGEVRYTTVGRGETLLDIARAFDLGHDQIIAANPHLNRWVPPVGAEVLLPSQYVLPPGERRGIVLNLAELRMYYFEPNNRFVHTFPVSIGDVDWRTPQGTTRIIGKEVNPAWYPPKSIQREHLEEGDELPTLIPGGAPDNPLGTLALKLAIPSYLIHGTDARRSYGIGMRVSHGCIRLYPEDIEILFNLVRVGTPVRIIDEPIKAGWVDGELFLEVHKPVEDDFIDDLKAVFLEDVVNAVADAVDTSTEIFIEEVERVDRLRDGIPRVVARKPRESHVPPAYYREHPRKR